MQEWFIICCITIENLKRAIIVIIEVTHPITCSPVLKCWVCIVGVDVSILRRLSTDMSGAVYHLYISQNFALCCVVFVHILFCTYISLNYFLVMCFVFRHFFWGGVGDGGVAAGGGGGGGGWRWGVAVRCVWGGGGWGGWGGGGGAAPNTLNYWDLSDWIISCQTGHHAVVTVCERDWKTQMGCLIIIWGNKYI